MLRPLDPKTGQPYPIDSKSGLPVFEKESRTETKKVTRRTVSDMAKPEKPEEPKPPNP